MALIASLSVILVLTAIPQSGRSNVELVPLGDIVDGIRGGRQGLLVEGIVESAANIALFMPLGAALALRECSIRRVALYGCITSAFVEGAQLFFISGRTTSVSDLLLNTLGAVLGSIVMTRVRRSRSERSAGCGPLHAPTVASRGTPCVEADEGTLPGADETQPE